MDTGDTGSALARLGGQIAETGQEIHRRNAQAEISRVSAEIAKAHAGFSTDLDDTLNNADPGDHEIADKFMQKFDDHLDGIADKIETPEAQQYFERASAQMRGHFQVASMHGQAVLAGQDAVATYNTEVDGYTSSLVNDPSAFDSVKDLANESLDARVKSGALPRAKADELRAGMESQLAKSAIRGWINPTAVNAPEKALEDLNAGKWNDYFSGDQKYQLIKEAEQGIHAKSAEAGRQQKLANDVLTQQQTATQNDFLAKIQSGKLSTADILKSNLDPFGSGSKESFLKMIETNSKQKIEGNPGTQVSIWNRIHLPDGDPKKITDPNLLNTYFGKGLTLGDIQNYRKEMEGTRTPEGKIESQLKNNFLKTVETKLTKPNAMGIKDPIGMQQYQAFLSTFLPEYDKRKSAGKNPQDLLNPKHADFMGGMAETFYRTPDQIMNDMVNQMSGKPPAPAPTTTGGAAPGGSSSVPSAEPRRPGETIQQWKARTAK